MSNDDEFTSDIILPIVESDESDCSLGSQDTPQSGLSMDPSLHDIDHPYSDDDMPEPEEPPHLVCERCGAGDQDLDKLDDGCYVCITCHVCQLCGLSEPQLVDYGDGLYICTQCCEQTQHVADVDDESSNVEATIDHSTADIADPALQHAVAQQPFANNPVNTDADATQWGVPILSNGPTDFIAFQLQ